MTSAETMIDDGFGGVVICGMPLKGVFRYVRAQRINGNGISLWGELLIVGPLETPAGGHAGYVGIVTEGSGNYVFMWNTGLDLTVDISARMINQEGRSQWGITIGYEEVLSLRNDLAFNGNFLISDKNLKTIVTWRARGSNDAIRAQSLHNDGTAQWGKGGVILSDKTAESPQIVSDINGGAIVCWNVEGPRRVSLGVYAQQISKNGKLGEIVSSIKDNANSPAMPYEYTLYQSYPNPFNASMRVHYRISEYAHVSIAIYSMTGKEVVRLVNRNQPAGEYFVDWDGKDGTGQPVASGVYLYRLKTNEFNQVRKCVLIK